MRTSIRSRILRELRASLWPKGDTAGAFSDPDKSTSADRAARAARELIERDAALAAEFSLHEFTRLALLELRRRANRPVAWQPFLPGLDLAVELPLRKGTVALGEATIQQLRESLRVLRAARKARVEHRIDTRIGQVARLIKQMAPYARRRHGLAVAGYCDLREREVAGEEFGQRAGGVK